MALAGVLPGGAAVRAEERHRHEPEHVERRHERSQDREHPNRLVGKKRAEEDLVLAEESGQGEDAGDCQRADEHRDERHRHVLLQSAHAPHVLFASHCVNDRAAAKEQQRFEERMRHQVEGTG